MTGQVLLGRNVAGTGSGANKEQSMGQSLRQRVSKEAAPVEPRRGATILKKNEESGKEKKKKKQMLLELGGITRCLPLSDALTLLFPKSPSVPTFTMPGINMPARTRYWIPSKSFISQLIPRQVSREGGQTFRWQQRQHRYQQRHWRQHHPSYHCSRSLGIRCCRCSNRRGWARKRWIP